MGILQQNCNTNNILTENGFKYKPRSVTGDLKNCFEKCIDLGLYYAWIAVNTDTRRVLIYVEYDCGGEVARYTTNLLHLWKDSEEAFFEELDEYVTDRLEYYRE